MIEIAETTLTTRDGARLAARWLSPPDPGPTVVLHPATAAPARFYAPFAQWLAGHAQARVLLYDYRDCGLSRRPGRASASMGDWLALDQDAALDAAARAAGEGPLDVVGHSLGGLGLMFHAAAPRVRRLVAVASGPAWRRRHPLRMAPQIAAFWFLVGPATSRLLGHVPRRITGFGADVPREAFAQWKRWCAQPHFHRVDWGGALPRPDLGAFSGELRIVAAEDDGMIPPATARRLADLYPAATPRLALLTRAAAGGLVIGHEGMFRASRGALWPAIWGA